MQSSLHNAAPVSDAQTVRLALRHGGHREVRHEGDGRQRLAAEAEGADGLEILELAQLAGRVPLAQDRQVLPLQRWGTLVSTHSFASRPPTPLSSSSSVGMTIVPSESVQSLSVD